MVECLPNKNWSPGLDPLHQINCLVSYACNSHLRGWSREMRSSNHALLQSGFEASPRYGKACIKQQQKNLHLTCNTGNTWEDLNTYLAWTRSWLPSSLVWKVTEIVWPTFPRWLLASLWMMTVLTLLTVLGLERENMWSAQKAHGCWKEWWGNGARK